MTFGRWLGAPGSVYIALTDQAKTARRQKSLQQDLLLQVDASTRQHASAVHMRSATVSICLLGSARHASHALRVCSGGTRANCLLFSRGEGSWLCRAHIKGLCLRNCTPDLPATCTRHHAPRRGLRTCNNTFIYLDSSLTRPAPLKISFAHTLRLALASPR